MSAYDLVVVSGGLRVPSSTRLLADRLADATSDAVRLDGDDVTVTVVELRDLAHEVTDALLTGFPAGRLREAVDAVAGADGLVVVTPTFSASFSGLFKSFFDVLDADALRGTPVLMAATGGTERHSLVLEYALRPLFAYLHAEPVPTGVYAATGDFGADAGLGDRVDRAALELAAAMRRRVAERASAAPHVEGLPVVPFADLLAAGGH